MCSKDAQTFLTVLRCFQALLDASLEIITAPDHENSANRSYSCKSPCTKHRKTWKMKMHVYITRIIIFNIQLNMVYFTSGRYLLLLLRYSCGLFAALLSRILSLLWRAFLKLCFTYFYTLYCSFISFLIHVIGFSKYVIFNLK